MRVWCSNMAEIMQVIDALKAETGNYTRVSEKNNAVTVKLKTKAVDVMLRIYRLLVDNQQTGVTLLYPDGSVADPEIAEMIDGFREDPK